MLSIFSICTIRIFDGYNWPFYAVTANAVISLFGLIFHVHLDEREQKRPAMLAARILLLLNSLSVFVMIGFSLFILNSQYHNLLKPDGRISSPAEIEQLFSKSGKDVLLLETDDLYIYYADYHDLSFAAGKRPSKDDQDILMCVAAAFQSSYQLGFSHDNIVGWHASEGQLERGYPQENLGAFTYVDGTARIWDTGEWAFSSLSSSSTGSRAAITATNSDAIACLRSSTEEHASSIPVPRCIMTILSTPSKIWGCGMRCTAIWEADGTIPGIAAKTGSLSISSALHGRSPTTGLCSGSDVNFLPNRRRVACPVCDHNSRTALRVRRAVLLV